jgi:elongation factor 1-gamma
MEVLHTSYILKANIIFEDADLEDITKRNSFAQKTPTTTLPFLETPQGNISESISIETFLANKFRPDLLGSNILERAKVNQWIEFGSCEIQKCLQEIIYPIFNWKELNKEMSDNANKKLNQNVKILEKQLKHGKKYILGDKITLADIVLFRYLRYFMMLHFPENLRNSLLPKVTKWFENIMKSPEAIEAYGRTILCKKQLRPLNIKIDRSKRLELFKNSKVKKEINPLDSLPSSSFNLEQFKTDFMEEKGNKDEIMKKFWKEFDPKGYSLWWLEYQNLSMEGKKII